MAGYRFVYRIWFYYYCFGTLAQSIDHCVRLLPERMAFIPLDLDLRARIQDFWPIGTSPLSKWTTKPDYWWWSWREKSNFSTVSYTFFKKKDIVLYKCMTSCRWLESNNHVLKRTRDEGHESDFKSVSCFLFCFVFFICDGCISQSLALVGNDVAQRQWRTVGGRTRFVANDWVQFFLLFFFFFLWSHKEILNHNCSTSLFVECMLVMFMLEPLCKICL